MRRDISMMDAAFKALEAHEGSITFAELMGEVAKELEMSDEEKLASVIRTNIRKAAKEQVDWLRQIN